MGNTPGVLTESTAEIGVALTLAASRRIVESDLFIRGGQYKGWLPTLFRGQLFHGKTVGIIGAGRIGSAYARMMVEGHKMNLLYQYLRTNEELERYVADYSAFLVSHGEAPVNCRRVESVEELLREADVVSLHTVLDASTRHLINRERLSLMKPAAILSGFPVSCQRRCVAFLARDPARGRTEHRQCTGPRTCPLSLLYCRAPSFVILER